MRQPGLRVPANRAYRRQCARNQVRGVTECVPALHASRRVLAGAGHRHGSGVAPRNIAGESSLSSRPCTSAHERGKRSIASSFTEETGATPRHPKGLSTCCHGEEPHTVGWRFVNERRAISLDPNCGWARGKADVLYVADAFQVMAKVNESLAKSGG